MSGQCLIIAFRGFKVRPQTLDKFLAMHGDIHGTENGKFPPRYHYDDTGAASDKTSDVLRSRATAIQNDSVGDNSGIFVIVPSVYPHDRSPWVYVAYNHTFVYSQRLIPTEDFGKEAPPAFEQLRQEILDCTSTGSRDEADEGLMGFYIVATGNRSGPIPAELLERRQVLIPSACFLLHRVSAAADCKWRQFLYVRTG
jgi:hypothetical protein